VASAHNSLWSLTAPLCIAALRYSLLSDSSGL